MNNIVPFNYHEKQVRTILKDGEPWFVAKDACDILDISNANMAVARLDDDEVSQTEVIDSMGRTQNTNIINEMGLYNLILRSDKPEAKEFKRWITHEVIPSIRKTGNYSTSPKLTVDQALEIAAIIRTTDRSRLPIIKDIFSYAGINIEVPAPNSINFHIQGYFENTSLHGTVKAADVYRDYLNWCGREGHIPVSHTLFGHRMSACGIGKYRTRSARFYMLQN